ncbi:MAG: hypothetical protein ACFFCS_08775 [Candidatus Hodarchaeota archaeon]
MNEDKRMDYFGWILSERLFTGTIAWVDAMELSSDDGDEFEPSKEGWLAIFQRVARVLRESGLEEKYGAALMFSPNIAPFLENLGLDGEYKEARDDFSRNRPFDLGIHARHKDEDLVNTPSFPAIFREDLGLATRFNASSLTEHPPIGTNNTIKETVDILVEDWFCRLLDENPGITLAWENKADYAHKRRFFGSLARMVEFREALSDKLDEIGRGALLDRHQFCFDTGHLLIFRGTAENTRLAEKEIEEYLPIFARNIKVFHFQANDGIMDGHVTPFSTAFLDQPSRTRMDIEKLKSNFDFIRAWIRTCRNTPHPPEQHYFLETGTLPFSLDQYIDFGKELALILKDS